VPSVGKVEGAARLSRTLDHAADEIGDLDSADAASAQVAARATQARAPRLTGFLAGSVRAESGEGAGRVVVDARYAGYVEYGAPSRHIPARPFLAQSAEAVRPAVENIYGDDVARAVAHVKGA
jgi:hypothetical protein